MKIKEWLIVINCDEELKKPLVLKKAFDDIAEELNAELIDALNVQDTETIEKILFSKNLIKILKTICEKRNRY